MNFRTKLYTLLLAVIYIPTSAQSIDFKSGNRYFKMPSNVTTNDFLPNTLIAKLKPEFRAIAGKNTIDQADFNKTMALIQANSLAKMFPNHSAPKTEYNEQRQKYSDLSLIYTLKYNANISIEKVINRLYNTAIFEYVQPYYIPQLLSNPFTPNDASTNQQYSIVKMKADSAWSVNNTTAKGDTNVVIGITDTGIEYTHPDLGGNIKYNYLEIPNNGIDDDGDNYIDNYRGWDIGENDNNATAPSFNPHGVHVSGIAGASTNNGVGIAGIGFKCKLLPIKIADANGSLVAAYQGIVYGADHGCTVINCSWGSSGGGPFGQSIIDYATINKNCLVVAASGNDGQEEDFYPAAYNYVISVAATNNADAKAGFSNYGYSVDLCAPGIQIYSTYSGGSYSSQDGTSMASPNAAGAAAIVKSVFPTFTALQVGEQLKASCDNISIFNSGTFANKIGKGRINLYKAITSTNLTSVMMTQRVETDNNDDTFVGNDTIRIAGTYTNYLAPTTNLTATLSIVSGGTFVSILDATTSLGAINTLATTNNNLDPFQVKVSASAPLNTEVTFKITFNDGSYTSSQFFKTIINVDYINIAINDVGTTITSKGLIGYNADGKQQGIGFKYSGESILYDASLMIGNSSSSVSDMARSITSNPDQDFQSVTRVKQVPSVVSDFDVDGVFNDNGAGSTKLNLLVHHNAYAWTAAGHRKYVMVKYAIKNNSTSTINNLFAGIVADWDIFDDNTFGENRADFDASNKMGYAYYTGQNPIYAGIKLLSNSAPVTHYAIDNINGGNGGVNLFDGFDASEKYTTLSTSRNTSGVAGNGADVIDVVSTGPFTILPGDSAIVGFALIAGDDLDDIKTSAANAQIKWDSIGVTNSTFIENTVAQNGITLYPNYPNPFKENTDISFYLPEDAMVQLKVIDLAGKEILNIAKDHLKAGKHHYQLNLSGFDSGIYTYQLTINNNITLSQKMTFVK